MVDVIDLIIHHHHQWMDAWHLFSMSSSVWERGVEHWQMELISNRHKITYKILPKILNLYLPFFCHFVYIFFCLFKCDVLLTTSSGKFHNKKNSIYYFRSFMFVCVCLSVCHVFFYEECCDISVYPLKQGTVISWRFSILLIWTRKIWPGNKLCHVPFCIGLFCNATLERPMKNKTLIGINVW